MHKKCVSQEGARSPMEEGSLINLERLYILKDMSNFTLGR